MAKLSSRPLRANPFHAYRDPETGKWMVVESTSSETDDCSHIDSLSSGGDVKRETISKIDPRKLCEKGAAPKNPEFKIQAMADS